MNPSGIEPVGNRILVKPDSVEKKSEGGIILTDDTTERHAMATCYGVVLAMGEDCYTSTGATTYRWLDSKWVPFEKMDRGYVEPWCKVGDRVAYCQWSGGLGQTGKDGEKYKVMNDVDVTAVVESEITQTTLEARKPVSNA